jgi:Mrp family chromosome partitioning ATPase/capsular polysaccharide biosynthesis protein
MLYSRNPGARPISKEGSMPSDVQPTLAHYAQLLRRQALLVGLVFVVAVGSAAAVVSQQTSIYRASSKIVVGQNGGVFQAQFGSAVDPFTQTMTNLLKSEIVAQNVVKNLRLRISTKELLKRTHVVARPNESVLEVSYDTPNANTAVPILSEIDKVFGALVKDRLRQAPVSTGTNANPSLEPVTATIFDPAHLQPGRVAPRPALTLGLAGILGLVVGLVLGIVHDGLDQGVRSRSEAESWFGAGTAGRLPRGLRGKQAGGIASTGPHPLDVELALNLLKANIDLDLAERKPRHGTPVILVTSARPDEGKSTVVANLGVTLANAGNRVICVEADLRRPRLAHYFDLRPDGVGLFDVFESRLAPEDALQRVSVVPAWGNSGREPTQRVRAAGSRLNGSLQVLGAGKNRGISPSTLFTAERVEQLIAQLASEADYLIFDSPPILVAADAYPIALAADQVLVVARYRRTTREHAETMRSTLAGLGAKSVSIVLTDWPAQGGTYGYGYGAAA